MPLAIALILRKSHSVILQFQKKCFFNCINLEKVILVGNRIKISENAFEYCHSLKTIDFAKITSIGSSSFSYSGIQSIQLHSNLKYQIDSFSFNNIKKLEFLDSGPFEINFGYSLIHNIKLPKNCILNNGSFMYCQNLEEITLADDCETIPDEMFSHCYNLKKVFAKNVKSVGANAFVMCMNLHTIEMPKLKKVAYKAFYRCNNLELNLDTLDMAEVDMYSFALCHKISLTKVEFNINKYSFAGCEGITEITTYKSSDGAFKKCKNLRTVNIYCDKISEKMFFKCVSLQKVMFINNQIRIYSQAFAFTGSINDLDLTNAIFYNEIDGFSESCFAHSKINSVKVRLEGNFLFFELFKS